MTRFHRHAVALIVLICLTTHGCASSKPSPKVRALSANSDVDAYVDPPADWIADPLKSTPRHKHQVWISPSGNSAYGVIRFTLPLPVGHDLALWGFLQEMRRSEGEATLVSKTWDQNIDGVRFVANGGLYHVRVNLFVRGFRGWAVYAGALRQKPRERAELELAEQARERTRIGPLEEIQPGVGQ